MAPLLPEEDKNFGNSLILDFRIPCRHVQAKNQQQCKFGKQTNCLVLVNGFSPVQIAVLKITRINRHNVIRFRTEQPGPNVPILINTYLRGLCRKGRRPGDETVGQIEKGRCYTASESSYANKPEKCVYVDWQTTLVG